MIVNLPYSNLLELRFGQAPANSGRIGTRNPKSNLVKLHNERRGWGALADGEFKFNLIP